MVFLKEVLKLNNITESKIPVQHYSVFTIMRDNLKEMMEVNSQIGVCTLNGFLARAEVMVKNFDKGLPPTSEFFTKDILSIENCAHEKEFLLYDKNQREILNKFYIASHFINELSNLKEPDTEDPIKLWYLNIHTNQETTIWLNNTYNLDLANSKFVGAIHKYALSLAYTYV